jgi:hypothetical protein
LKIFEITMFHFQIFRISTFFLALLTLTINAVAGDTLRTQIDSLTQRGIEQKNPALVLQIPQQPADSQKTPGILPYKKMFDHLGELHRLKGIYGVVTGTLGILAGVVLLDKADSTPFAMSFIALGGISIGFGIWEMRIGSSLLHPEIPAK